jgi:hypothetical protein
MGHGTRRHSTTVLNHDISNKQNSSLHLMYSWMCGILPAPKQQQRCRRLFAIRSDGTYSYDDFFSPTVFETSLLSAWHRKSSGAIRVFVRTSPRSTQQLSTNLTSCAMEPKRKNHTLEGGLFTNCLLVPLFYASTCACARES